MTTWEYKGQPPYPKNRGDLYHFAVSLLRIEDKNKKIDFQKDDGFWFEANYYPSGSSQGSIRSYIASKNHKINTSFVFYIEYPHPFTLIIKSDKDLDLSGLSATLFRM